jgi:hypothetical protein
MRFIAAVTIAAVMFLICWLIPSSRRKKIRRRLGIVGFTLVIWLVTRRIFYSFFEMWEWFNKWASESDPLGYFILGLVWAVLLSLWVKRWKMFKPEPSKPVVDVDE